MQAHPNYQDLVLVGGGHAHAIVLQMWAMNPLPGARLTLVSPQIQTPYSGMVPGLIAGHYEFDQTHIDLMRLCRAAGARFIRAAAEHIDPVRRRIHLQGRPELEYDLLSLDVGSTPVQNLPGAEHATPIKPVGRFYARWQSLQQRLRENPTPTSLGVVGGGAGGCELAMALAWALREPVETGAVQVHLIHSGEQIPQGYPPMARRQVAREMTRLGVHVHRNWKVSAITAEGLVSDSGELLQLDEVLLCTPAGAPAWLANSELELDQRGFVLVDTQLRALGQPTVFAVGDVASFAASPLPKAGVYAVRQGPVLFHNLRAALTNRPMRQYRPQQRFLSLLSCGGRRAVAVRNGLAFAGELPWRWKDAIDQKFMHRFSDLPVSMSESTAGAAQPRHRQSIDQREGVSLAAMRCNGCGAKIGAGVLSAALRRLPRQQSRYLLRGAGDDAAVMELPPGQLLVQSSDQLRAPVSDPWLCGRLAALHALSDLFAMHAQPIAAQALVTLPAAAAELTQRDLYQLLRGAVYELNRHHCVLSGGHSAEGTDLQLGFTVNGLAQPGGVVEKTGLRAGDCLILTKPLGVGTIFAAEGQGQAQGRWVARAIDSMLQSNDTAARVFAAHSAHAMTDVTGFGLLGHLLEMLGDRVDLRVTLIADRLPLLEGAAYCIEQGWLSSLAPQNAEAMDRIANPREWQCIPQAALLIDPQTCGGLLAAVPAAGAEACLRELHQAGLESAAIVGCVTEINQADREDDTSNQRPVRLLRSGDWRQLLTHNYPPSR
ncbi:selenide, water dikinase SelD [Microbulbifer discodermiae]|uniref:selenide, water dikinase SelD n=1 Tax=Microbulbifer sp. 2201CG32-9 TaxID=3232309 RepID=UPI00345BC0A1